MSEKLGRGKWVRKIKPIQEMFEQKFIKTEGGCWEWKSNKGKDGSGVFSRGGKRARAHRVAWLI